MMSVHRYAAPSRWLHWITAVLVAAMLILGGWIAYADPPHATYEILDEYHQGIGVVVFALVLLRLLSRWANGAPPLPRGTPPVIRRLAGLNHFAFYALLLAQPVIGFLDTNANGFPLDWFGVLPIPSPLGKSAPAAQVLDPLHWYVAAALLVLIGLHLLGVLYHAVLRRDGLLRRML